MLTINFYPLELTIDVPDNWENLDDEDRYNFIQENIQKELENQKGHPEIDFCDIEINGDSY